MDCSQWDTPLHDDSNRDDGVPVEDFIAVVSSTPSWDLGVKGFGGCSFGGSWVSWGIRLQRGCLRLLDIRFKN